LFGYAFGMTDFSTLIDAAYKAERSAARRLAAREGIAEEQALRRTLTIAAGAAGLPALLAERAALRDADAARKAARTERQALAARVLTHDAEGWRAWFDGSAHPNPGRCGIGGLLLAPGGARTEIARGAGYGNSSEAEYQALLAVLQAAAHAGAGPLTVYGDSRVVIDDMNGPLFDAAPSLATWRAQAQALLGQLGQVDLRWVPRHKNLDADALSQQGVRMAPPPEPV
jgi:ribonuclease HI